MLIQTSNLASQKWTLKATDFLKGALVAIGTAVLPSLAILFSSGHLPTKPEFITIGMAGVAAFITYLSKNLGTDNVKAAEKTLITAKTKDPSENPVQ